jgi:type II secretory pathway pseudopilin PulG
MNGDDDGGETLIELLMAVAIMGIAVVAIVGGIGTSILMSDVHRKQATAGAVVRQYAEAIESSVAAGNYVDCATVAAYSSPPGLSIPPGYTATATAASSWTGLVWDTCSIDNGYQKITLTVRSNDTRASESLDVILRKPCGTGSTCT